MRESEKKIVCFCYLEEGQFRLVGRYSTQKLPLRLRQREKNGSIPVEWMKTWIMESSQETLNHQSPMATGMWFTRLKVQTHNKIICHSREGLRP